jgi:SagB-type dehydrogenase family enzyme
MIRAAVFLVACLLLASCVASAPDELLDTTARFDTVIDLPEPDRAGTTTLETTLVGRRSRRLFTAEQLELETVGQLLWAGQGITDGLGHRTAPSAGARYPLELYVVTDSSVAHYLPSGHRLESRGSREDLRSDVADAAFAQDWIAAAPALIIVIGVDDRTEVEYGAVASSLVDSEAGHAAQNILLQAEALGLAATPVGGLDGNMVRTLLALPPGYDVRYIIPVGHPS